MASFKHRGNGKVQITITYGKRFDGKPNRFYRVNAISRSDVRDWVSALLAEGNTVTHKPLEPKPAQIIVAAAVRD